MIALTYTGARLMGAIACVGLVVLIVALIAVVNRPRNADEADYMQERDRRGLMIIIVCVVIFGAIYLFSQ
jgi:hypothetical protein